MALEQNGTAPLKKMRPEHHHYDTIEGQLRSSISEGRNFLFDSDLFDQELRRLWDAYDVPYEVSSCVQL